MDSTRRRALSSEAGLRGRTPLHDKGQPPLVRRVIVERIIAAAKLGERDPDRLCESALRALGSKAVFER